MQMLERNLLPSFSRYPKNSTAPKIRLFQKYYCYEDQAIPKIVLFHDQAIPKIVLLRRSGYPKNSTALTIKAKSFSETSVNI
jgi:hypothetical protein